MRENGHFLIEATDRAEVGEDLVGIWDRKAKAENYPAACARVIFSILPAELVAHIVSFIIGHLFQEERPPPSCAN